MYNLIKNKERLLPTFAKINKIRTFAGILLLITGISLNGCTDANHIPKAETGKVHLFWKGKSNFKIIISKDASETEKTAASELQKYLTKITGFEIPVETDDKIKAGKPEILIGRTNRENGQYTVDREKSGTDGFQIFWAGKQLVIAGGNERGTLYGVYGFLESLGCRFFTADVENVPKEETITLSLTDSIMEKPVFEYRDVFWTSVFDVNISVKLRLNGSAVLGQGSVIRDIPKEQGGVMRFTKPNFVHTFPDFFPPEKYFAEHPEYFSEIKGKRTAESLYSQPCLTNPDVLRIAIENVKSWLRADPEGQIISVSQDDSYVNESYCTCKACAAIDKEEDSHAGTLIRFVNAVADAVKDEFPDAVIETLAYQYSRKPPKITKPRDNVIIRIGIARCKAHPIESCPNNLEAKNVIEEWAKICNRLYIWDYTTNFHHYLAPFPNLRTLQPNVRFFAENSVKGVFEQGYYHTGKTGEFEELRAYMLAKLLWNPYTDIEKHEQEFLDTYYGSASPYVKQYLDVLHGFFSSGNDHFSLNFDPVELYEKYMTDEILTQFDSLWEQAKNAADNNEIADHVKRSEMQYRYYKLLAGRKEFTDKAQKAQFFRDCRDLGITYLEEGLNIPPPDSSG